MSERTWLSIAWSARSLTATRTRASLLCSTINTPVSEAAATTHAAAASERQSRSGRPGDPWLEPDICDYLRRERAAGLDAAVLCPVGFLCDHVEVLYDLDHEAAAVCKDLALPVARAETVNDDPIFLDMLADVVSAVVQRYRGGTALEVVA